MLKWELIKLLRQKSIYIAGIFLFGWFAIITLTNTTSDVYDTKLSQKIFSEWEGPITKEKIEKAEKLNAETNNYMIEHDGEVSEDLMAKNMVSENIAYSKHIISMNKERETDLDGLIIKFRAEGNNAVANKLELQKEMYSKVKLDRISYYRAPLEAIGFVNVFGLILTGVFLVLGLSGIYTNEHTSGVENYILSTKNGRLATMRAKLGAAFIYAAGVVVLWEIFNLAMKTALYGTKGWDLPIQYASEYSVSPYSLSFGEYHAIQIGLHLIAAIAFAGIIVIVSTLAKSGMISFFVSAVLFGFPLLAINNLSADQGWILNVFRYTVPSVMEVSEYFKNFLAVNLFGVPILAPYLGLAVSLIVLVLSILAAGKLIQLKQIA